MIGFDHRRERIGLAIGLVAGLAIRMALLRSHASYDMRQYLQWGTATLDQGLARGFSGIYFPFQYQLLAFSVWMSRATGLAPELAVKLTTLTFEAADGLLLIAILRRLGASPTYVLVYWLHPWFLSAFALGYVDPQWVCFVLLAIAAAQRIEAPAAWPAAGAALAVAALMKPQAVLLVVAAAFYGGWRLLVGRDRTPATMLVPIGTLFAAYELYFALALWPSRGPAAIAALPAYYVRVGSVMPVLTADMLNAWYPFAFALKQPDAAIWTVSSKLHLLPHVEIRFAALLITLVALAWYAGLLARRAQTAGDAILRLFTFTALIVPAMMTSAHENHLFLATVLFVPMLAVQPAAGTTAAIHIALALQFVNLEGTYGSDSFAAWLHPLYMYGVRAVLSLVAVAAYAAIAWALCRRFPEPAPSQPIAS